MSIIAKKICKCLKLNLGSDTQNHFGKFNAHLWGSKATNHTRYSVFIMHFEGIKQAFAWISEAYE